MNTLLGHTHSVWCVAISPDNSKIVSGSFCEFYIWDMYTGTTLQKINGHTSWIRCISFYYDNSIVITGSDDNNIYIWDIKTGLIINKLINKYSIRCIAFSK